MSKRQTLFVSAALIIISSALLFSSFSIRVAFAVLAFVVSLVLIAKAFLNSQTSGSPKNEDDVNRTDSPEVFAVGQLFEATMGGMREGLLVVNRDMRVVASNRAAYNLFNPGPPKLESQRLTELTRNPAIYGAFLDALKGEERSGVKV